jgi:hypothetical protein
MRTVLNERTVWEGTIRSWEDAIKMYQYELKKYVNTVGKTISCSSIQNPTYRFLT